jgi:hypothetical protein
MPAKYYPGPLWVSFKCPGLPKMNPRVSKMSPRGAQRNPKTSKMGPKCSPRIPKVSPKASMVSQGLPKWAQRLQKRCPRGLHVEKQHTQQLEMYNNFVMFQHNNSLKTPSLQTSRPERTSTNFDKHTTRKQIPVTFNDIWCYNPVNMQSSNHRVWERSAAEAAACKYAGIYAGMFPQIHTYYSKHNFWPESDPYKSSGSIYIGKLHRISTRIQWSHSQTPKITGKLKIID